MQHKDGKLSQKSRTKLTYMHDTNEGNISLNQQQDKFKQYIYVSRMTYFKEKKQRLKHKKVLLITLIINLASYINMFLAIVFL